MENQSTQITPYLFFGGRCEEALEHYKSALGAEVEMVMRFSDSPEPMPEGALQPGFENKVMHSSFRVKGNTIMASDGCESGGKFEGFQLALSLDSEEEAHRAYNALAKGGSADMPLEKTFWSPCYGMLTDKFGVGWMVMVTQEMG